MVLAPRYLAHNRSGAAEEFFGGNRSVSA